MAASTKMKFSRMRLREYFEKRHDAEFQLWMSDSEPIRMSDLLDEADSDSKAMWDNLTLQYTRKLSQ